ncbi:hemolysin III [Acidobacteria bacterium ACD]|nr:MAG: hemolysin III [Acidobacteriota bacterium]MCE7958052.1 hemolysin III [Acidobacteria bacterium ACB2]MDL1950060.1 hemolysin III [Acidobacteria bacterium ACD]
MRFWFRPAPPPRPKLRGVSHEVAFFASLASGVALFCEAGAVVSRVAALLYAASLSAMYGVSALYHRVTWRPAALRVWRRLDHSMIFVLIAGTFTPFGLLVLRGGWSVATLVVFWAGAVGGVVVSLVWIDAPRWVAALLYLALGWAGLVTLGPIARTVGGGGVALLVVGGVLYSIGAVVYARKRPSPVPAVFGYHEVFHAFVIAASACHWAAVRMAVSLPR